MKTQEKLYEMPVQPKKPPVLEEEDKVDVEENDNE